MPKLSQAVGKQFENNCETMHEEYRLLKLGFFWKNEIGSRVFYNQGRLITQKLPSKPDFSGVLTSGRYVTYDAKSTANKNKWTLPKKNLHQLEHMEKVVAQKGLAFFLLEARHINICFILRVVVPEASMMPIMPTIRFATAQLDPNIVSFHPSGSKIDWLDALVLADKLPFLSGRGG